MIALLAALALLQDNVPPPQGQIDKAVKEGAAAVIGLTPSKTGFDFNKGYGFNPLVLLTLVHCGIPLSDDTMQALLGRVLAAPLTRTYQVALTAAALAAIDPIKYQDKLARCAQFLVDQQCENGQWSYGDLQEFPEEKSAAGSTVATVRIKRIKKLGPASGDNSNSQYAALGLKSCSAGAIEIEAAALNRAIDGWEKSQREDGGWAYDFNEVPELNKASYGSMTAGGVGSLIMLKHLKKSDPKVTSSVTRGLKWLGDRFTVERNPDQPASLENRQFYYLYAMERACDLFPTEKVGGKAWYAIGANHLLKTQEKDGTWSAGNSEMVVADTCFALLFLQRAARRPVATK